MQVFLDDIEGDNSLALTFDIIKDIKQSEIFIKKNIADFLLNKKQDPYRPLSEFRVYSENKKIKQITLNIKPEANVINTVSLKKNYNSTLFYITPNDYKEFLRKNFKYNNSGKKLPLSSLFGIVEITLEIQHEDRRELEIKTTSIQLFPNFVSQKSLEVLVDDFLKHKRALFSHNNFFPNKFNLEFSRNDSIYLYEILKYIYTRFRLIFTSMKLNHEIIKKNRLINVLTLRNTKLNGLKLTHPRFILELNRIVESKANWTEFNYELNENYFIKYIIDTFQETAREIKLRLIINIKDEIHILKHDAYHNTVQKEKLEKVLTNLKSLESDLRIISKCFPVKRKVKYRKLNCDINAFKYNAYYKELFNILNRLNSVLKFSDYTKDNLAIGVNQLNDLYEEWVIIQVCMALSELGFKSEQGLSVESYTRKIKQSGNRNLLISEFISQSKKYRLKIYREKLYPRYQIFSKSKELYGVLDAKDLSNKRFLRNDIIQNILNGDRYAEESWLRNKSCPDLSIEIFDNYHLIGIITFDPHFSVQMDNKKHAYLDSIVSLHETDEGGRAKRVVLFTVDVYWGSEENIQNVFTPQLGSNSYALNLNTKTQINLLKFLEDQLMKKQLKFLLQ